jgi:anti-sigma B factor antagonist
MSSNLNIRETNGVSIVDVSGRIALGDGVGPLREGIRELADTGHRQILLNLAGISYLDSSGIGVLVSAFATLNRLGGHLKLVNLTGRVKDLLLITKLFTVFEVYDDEATAITSFTEIVSPAARG